MAMNFFFLIQVIFFFFKPQPSLSGLGAWGIVRHGEETE